jgi:hypothetical protein
MFPRSEEMFPRSQERQKGRLTMRQCWKCMYMMEIQYLKPVPKMHRLDSLVWECASSSGCEKRQSRDFEKLVRRAH